MRSKNLLSVSEVTAWFPEISFKEGPRLSWNPHTRTVTYSTQHGSIEDIYGLLHEIAHAELGHTIFHNDIELLKMERDAWHYAKKTAKQKLGVVIDDDFAEDCLDSYRDWLYKRASCPRCRLVGIQVDKNTYSCVHCLIDWRVPASRLCAVKRMVIS